MQGLMVLLAAAAVLACASAAVSEDVLLARAEETADTEADALVDALEGGDAETEVEADASLDAEAEDAEDAEADAEGVAESDAEASAQIELAVDAHAFAADAEAVELTLAAAEKLAADIPCEMMVGVTKLRGACSISPAACASVGGMAGAPIAHDGDEACRFCCSKSKEHEAECAHGPHGKSRGHCMTPEACHHEHGVEELDSTCPLGTECCIPPAVAHHPAPLRPRTKLAPFKH